MNKAILLGRLTRDPEVRYTQSNVMIANFTLAVDRRFVRQGEERQADFIPIVTFNKTAEFCDKYLRKGQQVVVVGRIQTRSWDDNEGKKRYVTEIISDEVYFADSRRQDSGEYAPGAAGGYGGRQQDDYNYSGQQYGNAGGAGGGYGNSPGFGGASGFGGFGGSGSGSSAFGGGAYGAQPGQSGSFGSQSQPFNSQAQRGSYGSGGGGGAASPAPADPAAPAIAGAPTANSQPSYGGQQQPQAAYPAADAAAGSASGSAAGSASGSASGSAAGGAPYGYQAPAEGAAPFGYQSPMARGAEAEPPKTPSDGFTPIESESDLPF
jgi:single-strand DNA-binding protein